MAMTTPNDPNNGGYRNYGAQQPLTPPPAQPGPWDQPADQAPPQYQNGQYQGAQYPETQYQGAPYQAAAPQGPQAPQWGQAAAQAQAYPQPPAYPGAGYYPAQPPAKRRNKALIIRLSILGVVAAVVVVSLLVKHFGSAKVDASGNVTKAGSLSVFSLKTGQCFDEPAVGTDVSSIKAIPCGQSHDAQVTGSTPLTADSYDENALDKAAGDACQKVADSAVDSAKLGDGASIVYFVPNRDDWNGGDHSATCAVDDGTTKLTGSVLK